MFHEPHNNRPLGPLEVVSRLPRVRLAALWQLKVYNQIKFTKMFLALLSQFFGGFVSKLKETVGRMNNKFLRSETDRTKKAVSVKSLAFVACELPDHHDNYLLKISIYAGHCPQTK